MKKEYTDTQILSVLDKIHNRIENFKIMYHTEPKIIIISEDLKLIIDYYSTSYECIEKQIIEVNGYYTLFLKLFGYFTYSSVVLKNLDFDVM